MKVLREIHDFIAGGSIVAPIGLALTIAAALVFPANMPATRAAIVLSLLVCTFIASTLERN